MKNLVEGVSNFTANAHFEKVYDIPEVEFTTPITSDRLCVIVPSSGKAAPFMFVVNSLNISAVLSFFSVYAVIGKNKKKCFIQLNRS
jgi:hypothetical protein